MRAVRCVEWAGPDRLRLETLPSPEPGPGEVRVMVRAAGVNFPDVLIIERKYQVRPELPFTPGAELAGEVVALGPGVSGLRVGDRVAAVCTTGGFAEEAVLPADTCIPLPDAVPFDVAGGLLLAFGTSWHALRDRAELRASETLLVLGASGGVGLAAVEIGHAMGARVVACASSPEKLALARERGADACIDYAAEELRPAIARDCGPRGPDVVFDPVGGSHTEAAFRSIAWRGRHLVVGFAAGPIPALPLNLPLLKGASLVGVFWGAFTRQEPERWRATVTELLDWVADGRLRPLVSRRYALDEVPQALRDMASRRVTGKVVVTP